MDRNLVVPIYLEFVLNPDTTYSVYSYSRVYNQHVNDTAIVSLVYYEFRAPDSIYLEEIEIIQSPKYSLNCFQKMFLKIKKENTDIILVGKWETDSENCNSSGAIIFRRLKKSDSKKVRSKAS